MASGKKKPPPQPSGRSSKWTGTRAKRLLDYKRKGKGGIKKGRVENYMTRE